MEPTIYWKDTLENQKKITNNSTYTHEVLIYTLDISIYKYACLPIYVLKKLLRYFQTI